MRINLHVLGLLIGISLGTGPALAQQWCPPGAMWSHTYFADGPEGIEDGIIVSKYLGDTLIGLQSMQLIERELRYRLNGGDVQFYPWPSFYTFISNGVVFSWDGAAQQADTLLWYSAVPGQHWYAYNLENVQLRYEVVDTSTVFIEGLALRQLIVNYILSSDVPPTILGHDTLIERIGLIGDDFFDPEIPWADGALMSFQCYSDEILDYRRSDPTICDFTLTVNPIEPIADLLIYPNPAKTNIRIKIPNGIPVATILEIYDPLGTCVHAEAVHDHEFDVYIGHLPQGIYFVRLGHSRHGNTILIKR